MRSRHTLTRKLVTTLALALTLASAAAAGAAAQGKPSGRARAVAIKYPLGQTVIVRLQPSAPSRRAAGRATVKRLGRRYTSVSVAAEGLPLAEEFGGAFTTYVLWAVTPEGRADNLAELRRNAFGAAKVEVTTTLETFALVVTAEPHFLMRTPSSMLVMKNLLPNGAASAPAPYAVTDSDYFKTNLQFNSPDTRDSPPLGAVPSNGLPVAASLLGAKQAILLAHLAGAERDAKEELRKAESAFVEAAQAWRSHRPEAEVDAKARAAISLSVKAEEATELNAARRRRYEEDLTLLPQNIVGDTKAVVGAHANNLINPDERGNARGEKAGGEKASGEKAGGEKGGLKEGSRGVDFSERGSREAAQGSAVRVETKHNLTDRGSRPSARDASVETPAGAAFSELSLRALAEQKGEAAAFNESSLGAIVKQKSKAEVGTVYDFQGVTNNFFSEFAHARDRGVRSDLARFGRLRATPRGLALVLPDNVWAGARAPELSPLAGLRLELLGALLASNPALRIAVEVRADGATAPETRRLARARIKAVADILSSAGVSGVRADAGEGGVEVKRYPSVECQEVVVEEQEFTVQVSLTQERVTPQVEVVRGADTEVDGRLAFTLPAMRDDPALDSWLIKAVILAPDFVLLDNSDIAPIKLPRMGDSQVVAFRLKPRSGAADAPPSQILVSFWHDGEFLARVARTVTVVRTTGEAKPLEVVNRDAYSGARAEKPQSDANESGAAAGGGGASVAEKLANNIGANQMKGDVPPVVNVGTLLRKAGEALLGGPGGNKSQGSRMQKGERQQQQQSPPVEVSDGLKPDLTLTVITRLSNDGRAFITVDSRYLQLSNTTFTLPTGADSWLVSQLKDLPAMRPRDPTAEGGSRVPRALVRERMRGFGIELYRRYAPPAFKQALWQLLKDHPNDFKTIQIYTDNPVIPWELMKPVSDDGVERDFLGLEFSIGRWHVNEVTAAAQRPPNELKLDELVAVVPRYTGERALPALSQEARSLASVPNFRSRLARGRVSELKELFAKMPDAIIHFAGHGSDGPPGEGAPYFTIELEDGQLDPLSWRGMVGTQADAHPLFFFNACEVGRAERSGNFVNGWAPVVLETGASGYIGALWPLSDRGAAEFARLFYGALGRGASSDRVAVSDVLRLTRREYLKNGDPTFLAYVYYGDPNLRLVLR